MRYSQYAILDNGANTTNGTPTPVVIGPVLLGNNINDGYTFTSVTDGYVVTSRSIDLGNISKVGILCSFLTGSTLAGSLSLQVCDDPEAPGSNQDFPNPAVANWLTLTAANTWGGSQVVAAVSVTSGAHVIPFEYNEPGHKWLRIVFTATSGSGTLSWAYTLKSGKS